MAKYNVGDKVIIMSAPVKGMVANMIKWLGSTMTIKEVIEGSGRNLYHMVEDDVGWYWSDNMIVRKVVESEQPNKGYEGYYKVFGELPNIELKKQDTTIVVCCKHENQIGNKLYFFKSNKRINKGKKIKVETARGEKDCVVLGSFEVFNKDLNTFKRLFTNSQELKKVLGVYVTSLKEIEWTNK